KVEAAAGNGQGALPLVYPTTRGHCRPFGATPRPGGVNFAVFSRHAHAVTLVLFKEGQEAPLAEIPLDPAFNRTGDVWHIFVYGLGREVLYGSRVYGPFDPRAGHRFNPRAVLLDPYAVAVSTDGGLEEESAIHNRCSRLVSDDFDWGDDVPPATPLAET